MRLTLPTLTSKGKFGTEGEFAPEEYAVWAWSKWRYTLKHLDWYWDENSFKQATVKMVKVAEILGDIDKVYKYIKWYLNEEDNFAPKVDWDFNYFASALAINRYLGNVISNDTELEYAKQIAEEAQERSKQLAAEMPWKLQTLEQHKREYTEEIKQGYAERAGTEADSVRFPFE
jgi:hypothetical protein